MLAEGTKGSAVIVYSNKVGGREGGMESYFQVGLSSLKKTGGKK